MIEYVDIFLDFYAIVPSVGSLAHSFVRSGSETGVCAGSTIHTKLTETSRAKLAGDSQLTC